MCLTWLASRGLQEKGEKDFGWKCSYSQCHTTWFGESRSEYYCPRAPLLIASSSPCVVAQQEKTPPPRPSLLEAGGDGCEEPKQQVSWEQEFLVGNSPGGSGRALCMVCGAEIRSPSADTARTHILEQHPHTLDLSPSEKSNILEAWSEGVALLQDVRAEQPSPPNSGSWAWDGVRGAGWREMSDPLEYLELTGHLPASDSGQEVDADPDSDPDPAKMPAEIVVLLDSEDNPSLPKRSRPRGLRPLELLGQSSWKPVRLRWGAGGEPQAPCSGGREAAGQVCSAALRLRGSGVAS